MIYSGNTWKTEEDKRKKKKMHNGDGLEAASCPAKERKPLPPTIRWSGNDIHCGQCPVMTFHKVSAFTKGDFTDGKKDIEKAKAPRQQRHCTGRLITSQMVTVRFEIDR